MITDRTYSDVERAIRIRAEKILKFIEPTEEERAVLERGFATISTIQRIEEKQREIFFRLKELGYFGAEIETKEWRDGDVFYMEDLRRIIKNDMALIGSFSKKKTTPSRISEEYSIHSFNALEKILVDLEEIISSVVSNYKFVGENYCGEFRI